MRAVVFRRYGGPDVLEVADVPEPHPRPGQIRIRVHASGVNSYDATVRSGRAAGGRPLDRAVVTGLEAAGVVDEVGDGVAPALLGQAVFGPTAGGAAAEHAVLRHWAAVPAGLGFGQAAGLSVTSEAAVRALRHLGLHPGDTVLVHGAAGGVGQAAIQLARHQELRVVGTARAANHDLLRRLGALPTTYDAGLVTRVAALAPRGVQGVVDAAGTLLPELIALVGEPQRVVSLANLTAGERGAIVTVGGADSAWDALPEVARLAGEGILAVRVVARFPFRDAAAAHRLVESRRATGKVVLVPAVAVAAR